MCPIQPRTANVEVVPVNAISREIMKKNASIVFHWAISNIYDATSTTYNDETLSGDIACLTTHQSPEYIDRTRTLLHKHKSICKPLESLPP
jgi:hypothetical protein